MASTRSLVGLSTSSSAIQAFLWNAWNQQSDTVLRMKTRRMFVSTDPKAWGSNLTGTMVPHPYNESPVTVRMMLGDGMKAAAIAASRLTANQPDIAVIPLSTTSTLNVTASRKAGEQERLDSQLWHENGGADNQWKAAWAKSVGGAAFWLTLPRDADFGLPDRLYVTEDDDEYAALKASGKLSAVPYGATGEGKLVYAEHGDVWAARRKSAMQEHAVSGRNLFSLSVYPRDMVIADRDRESKDLKRGAIIEEIPVSECAPGSTFAMSIAKAKGLTGAEREQWGIVWSTDRKKIIGGITQGGPLNSAVAAYDAFTLIRYFDREEMVILVAPRGSVQGATEVYRGKHNCRVQGAPACPLVEDPFYRTDINVVGKEYATALDPVFAWLAPINQLLTLRSQVSVYNSTPRLVGELHDGADMEDDDGQPIAGNSVPVPGLSASEIGWYPGKITQLLISDPGMIDTLRVALEQLANVMPSFGSDASGADAPGWALQMRIQEQQEPYREPVRNGCQAITGIIQRWHSWMRQLDVPVYFFPMQGEKRGQRASRGLIEFDPADLVDSIRVTQDVATSSEAVVRTQIGMEQWSATLIDDEEYYEKYARVQDAREAVIRRWVQIVTNYVMTGALPPVPPGGQPGATPMVQIIGDAVRGRVHYELIQQNDTYAIGVAKQMVAQAQMQQQAAQMAQQQSMPDGSGNVAEAAGAAVPGMGMANSLQQQLGPNVPGGQRMPAAVQ